MNQNLDQNAFIPRRLPASHEQEVVAIDELSYQQGDVFLGEHVLQENADVPNVVVNAHPPRTSILQVEVSIVGIVAIVIYAVTFLSFFAAILSSKSYEHNRNPTWKGFLIINKIRKSYIPIVLFMAIATAIFALYYAIGYCRRFLRTRSIPRARQIETMNQMIERNAALLRQEIS